MGRICREGRCYVWNGRESGWWITNNNKSTTVGLSRTFNELCDNGIELNIRGHSLRLCKEHRMSAAVWTLLCAATHGCSYVEAPAGNCLVVVWAVILHVTRSHKRTESGTAAVFSSNGSYCRLIAHYETPRYNDYRTRAQWICWTVHAASAKVKDKVKIRVNVKVKDKDKVKVYRSRSRSKSGLTWRLRTRTRSVKVKAKVKDSVKIEERTHRICWIIHACGRGGGQSSNGRHSTVELGSAPQLLPASPGSREENVDKLVGVTSSEGVFGLLD